MPVRTGPGTTRRCDSDEGRSIGIGCGAAAAWHPRRGPVAPHGAAVSRQRLAPPLPWRLPVHSGWQSCADGSLAVKASSGSRSRPRRLGLELEALKAQTPATPSRAHGRLLAAGGVLATARRAAHCDGTQAPSVAPLTAEDLVTSPPPAAAGRPAEMRGGGGHRGPGPSRGRRKRLCDD